MNPLFAAIPVVGALVVVGLAWAAIRRAPACTCDRADCGGGCLDEATLPGCFGSFPGWQQQAENDCRRCFAQRLCLGREPEGDLD